MLKKIEETAEWLRKRSALRPETAIILGSGLGSLCNDIDVEQEFLYADIPNFPVSTVEGHEGKLIVGRLADCEVIAMAGRFHFYEGYTMKEITFPVRVFHALGIKHLFASNAAGGTNPSYRIGDLMLITDHINMLPDNPLRGKNLPAGPRFPDMSEAYDRKLRSMAVEAALRLDIDLRQGVYLATQGPTYETPAEYRMFRLLGSDAVGMSTVPEIIVANHCGIRCLGISVITNIGQASQQVTHKEVETAACDAQPRMSALFKEILVKIGHKCDCFRS